MIIKIALVDSCQLFLAAFASYLERKGNFEIVYLSKTFKVKDHFKIPYFDVLIFDLSSELEEEYYYIFKEKCNVEKGILLSDRNRLINNLMFAREAQLHCCLSKSVEPGKLIDLIHEVYKSSYVRFISEKKEESLLNPESKPCRKLSFTNRELIILRLIINEKTSKEIAAFLNVSTRTVESHRRRMIQRTGSRNIFGVFTALEREKHFFSQNINSLRPEPFSLILN